jgi:hypothetical protein
MIFRPFYRFDAGCAAYVFGCGGKGMCVAIDPHLDDVDAYADFADAPRVPARRWVSGMARRWTARRGPGRRHRMRSHESS